MAAPYKSVLEMAQDNLPATSVRRLERRLADRIVISALCALRCSKDITQKQLAKKMGMSEKEIAALEDGTDHRISVPLLFKHASALGMNVTIILDTDKTDSTETAATHAIKQRVFEIRDYLDKLADLVQGDKAIHTGVNSFYKDYLYNILRLFLYSFNNLQGQTPDQKDMAKIVDFIDELTTDTVEDDTEGIETKEPIVVAPQKSYGNVSAVT